MKKVRTEVMGNTALREAYNAGHRDFFTGICGDYSLTGMKDVTVKPSGLSDKRGTRFFCGGSARVSVEGFYDAVVYAYDRAVVAVRGWGHAHVFARGRSMIISQHGLVMLYEGASVKASERSTVYTYHPDCSVIHTGAKPCPVREKWREGFDWTKPLQWVL